MCLRIRSGSRPGSGAVIEYAAQVAIEKVARLVDALDTAVRQPGEIDQQEARENLNVVTLILSNRAYAILQGQMRNVGVNDFGRNARRMLDLGKPELDWSLLARGMGVDAARADTIEQFTDLLGAALSRKGPFLIEARI